MTPAIPTSWGQIWAYLITLAPRIFYVLLYILIGYLVIKITIAIFERALKTARVNITLVAFISSILKALLWLLTGVLVLHTVGLTSVATAIASVIALFSLGIGLGAQYLISDLISGAFLAGEKNFRAGSHVVAGSRQTEGIIEVMDFRKVRLRDHDGRMHTLPNSDVEKNQWVVLDNNTRAKRGNR